MLKNLLPFLILLRPHRRRVIFGSIAGAVAGIGTGAGFAWGVKELFGLVFSEERNLNTYQVLSIGSIFPALFLVVGISTFLSGYYLNHAGYSVIRDIRNQLFEHIQRVPIAYFQTKKTGDLIARLTADTQVMQYSLSMASRDMVVAPITFISALGFLIFLGVGQEGVTQVYLSLIVLPIIIFPIRKLTSKLGRKAKQQQEELSSVTNNLSQNIGAAKEVRAFNLENWEISKFSKTLSDLFSAQMKVAKYTYTLSPVVELITSIGLAIAFVVGYKNNVSGDDFLAIFMALYLCYAPIKRISFLSGEMSKAKISLDRVQEILNQPIDIKDPDNPVTINSIQGKIEFKNVSFAYGNAPALKNVFASIEPGCVCALVGPSGAGKSTFANLVPRFYDVNSGSISIDGYDLRELRTKDLRQHIAVVSQDPVLFDDTIIENIRLGRQGANDQEVIEAARQAFADEFIKNQPDGYNTIVGERGTRLSGGQKQRIAIARAFLRNAPILILDEATSSLDSESEKKIQQALDQLVVGKTVLIIAHRFSTIRNAHKIIVFKNGEIDDEGTHTDLYDRCKLYRNLYDQQAT